MIRQSFTNRVLAILCALAITTQPFAIAHADAKDDAILLQGGKVAGKVVVSEIGRRVLNKSLGTVGTSTIGYGTGVLSVVQIGLSVKDFIDADTDAGRGHATAQTAVGVVTLIFPVAGLIAEAALIVYGLFEGSNNAQHAAHMMELEAQIRKDLARILEIETMFAKNEINAFVSSLEVANNAKKQINNSADFLKDNCQARELYDDLPRVDACVAELATIVSLQGIVVDRLTILVEMKPEHIDMAELFRHYGIDRTKILAEIKADRDQLQSNSERVKAQIKIYAHAISLAMKAKAVRENEPSEADRYVELCIDDMQAYTKRSTLFAMNLMGRQDSSITKLVIGVDRQALLEEGNNIADRGCSDVHAGDELLNNQMKRLLPLFQNSYDQIKTSEQPATKGLL